jgi:hypothetical protein
LPVNLGAGDWPGLLSAIAAAGKYVALDISAGAVPGTGTEFDPGAANTGESKIVSLVLPNAARSIKDSSYSEALFRYFTALKEVSGANIKTIGNYAFYNCHYLTTANFPAATSIGLGAFLYTGTTALTITLPKAAPTMVVSYVDTPSTYSKAVTIKTPAGKTGYDDTWQTNFKSNFGSGATITLSFEDL